MTRIPFYYSFFVLLFLAGFTVQVSADAHPSVPSETLQRLTDRPTVHLTLSKTLEADTETINFLLANLDLSTALVQALEIDRLEAEPIDENSYSARDYSGLEGTVVRVHQDDRSSSFFGEGRYRSPRFPLRISGEVLAEISLRSRSDTTEAEMEMYVRAINPVFHVTGILFRPYIRRVSRGKSANLTEVANQVARSVTRNPDETLDRLKEFDEREGTNHELRLREFLELGPVPKE